MRSLIKILLLTLMLCLTPAANTFAQSAASKYDEGVAQYNKGNYQGAIKLFNESMILNKSAANKKKCQAMIAKCNKASKAKKSEAQVKSKPVVSDKVTLERDAIYFDGHAAGAEVIGVKAAGGWNAELEHEADGSWCSIEPKDDGNFLIVKTTASNLTVYRTASIKVISDKNSREVKNLLVTQGPARNATLSVSKEEIKNINRAGDEQVISINCQSDTLLADGRNWFITKAPSWVKFLSTKKLGRKERTGITMNELSMQFEANPTKEERIGYIVVRSQDAERHIKLIQKKGK